MPRSPLQVAAALEALRQGPLVLGRERELAALRTHIRARRPVFISGSAGIGKTALLHSVYGERGDGTPAALYCGESNTRRSIATHVLVNLLLDRGHLESRYIERSKNIASLAGLRRFVAQERLPDLTRMMHQNLDRNSIAVLLDHLDHPDSKVASLIEIWLGQLPVIIAARTIEDVGRVRWLLSAFEHLALQPLSASASRRIARVCVANSHIGALGDQDIDEAITRCAGNPGCLVALLQAAARPECRKHGAVQWRLVDLDLRIRAIATGAANPTKSGAG